jgi:hypothetical protein
MSAPSLSVPYLYIQLWCVAPLRLQEYLVGLLVSKTNNLVLNGGAVPDDNSSSGSGGSSSSWCHVTWLADADGG